LAPDGGRPTPNLATSSPAFGKSTRNLARFTRDSLKSTTNLAKSSVDFAIYCVEIAIFSLDFAIYSAEIAIFSLDFAIFSLKIVIYSLDFAIYSVEIAIFSLKITIFSVDFAIYSLDFPIYSLDFPIFNVDFPIYSVDFAKSSVDLAMFTGNLAKSLSTLPRSRPDLSRSTSAAGKPRVDFRNSEPICARDAPKLPRLTPTEPIARFPARAWRHAQTDIGYDRGVQGSELDEQGFFGAIAASGARVLLIGRRAMIALGLPVATYDYDLWVHIDDIERLNGALAQLDHHPNRTPAEARVRGRYVLENGEHIDVMVARAQTAKDGERLSFDDAWQRKVAVPFAGIVVHVPCIEDLIRTKRWAMRAKDVADIQLLEMLRRSGGKP
jgi:hypothetical protein